MLKVGLATEVLPVRVLDPCPDQILIRAGEGVLQVEQTRDQARRTGGAPGAGRKELGPAGFEDRAVDQLGQFHQRVLEIDQLSQALLKQGAGRRMFAFGAHKNHQKFARNQGVIISFTANSDQKM